MAKVTINNKGVFTNNESEGFKASFSAANVGFSPFGFDGTTTVTATGDLSTGGVYHFSGSAAITGTLPSSVANPGMVIIVKAGSAHAHALTASNETAGSKPICDTTGNGSKVALAAVSGTCVILQSVYGNWVVLGNSGSLTFSGV